MTLWFTLVAIRTLVLFWACSAISALALSSSQEVVVGVDAPECTQNGTMLICDYNNHTQVVCVNQDLDSSVQMMVLSNAGRVNMRETMCVNITINNVNDVVIVKDEGDPCKVNNLEFSARRSTLDRLPRWRSELHLEDINITSLATDANITQLTVINSTIKVINISQPLVQGSSLTFLSSNIDTIERINSGIGSDVFLYKTSVNVVSPLGLLLYGGNVTLRESWTSTASKDSVVIIPGSTLSLENYTGSLTVRATVNATSMDFEPETSKHLCYCDPEHSSYFGVFIAMLILFLCLSIVTVFTGISLQRRKGRSASSLRSFTGYMRHKVREMSTDDFTTLLLQREIGCDHLLALEKLRYRVVSSFHTEILLHQSLIADIDWKFESEVVQAKKDTQDKQTHLESSKMAELRQIKAMFNQEIGKPTNCNWDKVKYILEQRKLEQEKLIQEKTREKIYDAGHRDNVQKLEQKVCIVRENKEFIMKLANLGRQTLSQWRKIIDSCDASLDATPDAWKLLCLMESLLDSRQSDMESKYDRQIEVQDKKYLTDLKTQEKRFIEKCTHLEKYYKESCNKIAEELKKELDSSPSTDRILQERMEELYEVKTHIGDVKLSLDMKKTQERFSEASLRVRHLDSVVQIQKGHMEDMEKLITIITDAQKFYVQVVRQSLTKTNEEVFHDEGHEEEDSDQQPEDPYSEGLHRHEEEL